MIAAIKELGKHSTYFAGVASVVMLFGVDNIEAWAQDKVTEKVNERVAELERKVDEAEKKRQEDSDEIKRLIIEALAK